MVKQEKKEEKMKKKKGMEEQEGIDGGVGDCDKGG